jgi:hypothetical protein
MGSGIWVRPVSARPDGELLISEQRLADRSLPAVMDVIEVPVLKPAKTTHQRENWEIDRSRKWTRIRQVKMSSLSKLLDRPDSLWGTGSSGAHGLNDRLPGTDSVDDSLYLIYVEDLRLEVVDRKTRGRFTYGGEEYLLSVTDLQVESAYRDLPGAHSIGAAYLTVSLGEPFGPGSYCYKFIAAVIRPDDGGRMAR